MRLCLPSRALRRVVASALLAAGCTVDNPDWIFAPGSDARADVDLGREAHPDLVALTDDAASGCRGCVEAGANCGLIDDGCGHSIACGACLPPDFCGGGGVANRCGLPVEPRPSCLLAVDPQVGDEKTTYTASVSSSHALSCDWSIDAGPPMQINCNGSVQGDAKRFGGLGNHLGVMTASGKGGQTSCSASWTIKKGAGAMPPSCTVMVAPPMGGLMQKFTFTVASMNATTCTAQVDKGAMFANPCNQTNTHFGFEFGPGKHTATLFASGPGGMTQCAGTWVVQ